MNPESHDLSVYLTWALLLAVALVVAWIVKLLLEVLRGPRHWTCTCQAVIPLPHVWCGRCKTVIPHHRTPWRLKKTRANLLDAMGELKPLTPFPPLQDTPEDRDGTLPSDWEP